MAENKYVRCAEDDPNRCQGVGGSGQCPYKAEPGSKYCPQHGGLAGKDVARQQALAGYRLQQYNERVSDFANNPEVKNLRAEIGILRMTLETLLTQCENTSKLLSFSDKITNMISQIQKLVEATQRIEERNNNLLDRKVVIVIADSIVTLIGQYITDPDQLNEIGGRICESIANAASFENPARVIPQVNHNGQPVGV